MNLRPYNFCQLLLLGSLVLGLVACGGGDTPTPTPTLPPPTQAPPPTLMPSPTSPPPPTDVPTQAPSPTQPPTTVSPTMATATSLPVTLPSGVVITPENASQLKPVASVNSGFPNLLAWSSNSRGLTALVERSLLMFDAVDLKQIQAISTTFAAQVFALSPDGTKIVGMADDNSAQLWDTASGKSLATLSPAGTVAGATFTPDSKTVATYSADQVAITLWDAAAGKQTRTLTGFQTAAPVYSAAFSADNKTLAWIARGQVQFMDLAAGALGAQLQFEDFVGEAEFTPDSKNLVTVSAGLLQVWSADKGERVQQLTSESFFAGLTVSPDGQLIATATPGGIVMWDWSQGKPPALLKTPSAVSLLTFSPDGSALVMTAQDGSLTVWRVQ